MKKFSKDEVYEKLENVLFKFFDEDLNKIENFMIESGKGDDYYKMLDSLCNGLVKEFELDDNFEILY